MNRPYMQSSAKELEALFASHRSNQGLLQELLDELGHRRTQRAVRLRNAVAAALDMLARRPQPGPASPRRVAGPPVPQGFPEPAREASAPEPVDPGPLEDAQVDGILNAWTALEVLSPQGFKRPADLVAGRAEWVAPLERSLPWEGSGEKSLPKKRLYYQVLLGELRLAPAFDALVRKYADDSPERPVGKTHAILAVVVCDKHGAPQRDTVAISSFGWGLPAALSGDLGRLGGWAREERRLNAALEKVLFRNDDDGRVLPLTRERMREAYDWIVKTLGLGGEFARPPTFAIRAYQSMFLREPPEPLLLNSFFLGDLARARTLFAKGQAPEALQRYLGASTPTAARDVFRDAGLLEDLLAPAKTPPARWPAPGRCSLVALQQAAVNTALGSPPGSIVAVNGPPGTGKTTLLRDVLAGVISARAEVLASFDDPEKAFTRTGLTFSQQKARFELRAISPKLHGFEVVVASSNNKAVENVSAELPGLHTIADDAPGLRYFASLAEALDGRPCWGLAAAVLGNGANVYRFQDRFWKDQDRGMEGYLSAAAGMPRRVVDERVGDRIPEVVRREQPPAGRAEALTRWRAARERFRSALAASREASAALQRVHELEAALRVHRERLEALAGRLPEVERASIAAEKELATQEARRLECSRSLDEAEAARQALLRRRPNAFARLFRTGAALAWREEDARSTKAHALATEAARNASVQCEEAQNRQAKLAEERAAIVAEQASTSKALSESRERLADLLPELNAPTGAQLAALPHAEKHRCTAWFDAPAQRKRDEVFIAAMALHKAFVDAAAEPIRHNLAGMMRQLWTGVSGATPVQIRDLWASFFLVVPLVSSTFASVEKMFGALAPEALGWLLLDEAGQATPQAAVGAILRARRVIVVGDPMQVEPVVMVPASLTRGICDHFKVDAVEVAAPEASVQTLADRASPVVATYRSRKGDRIVGVPLLVHRRCEDPMFGLSNAVAYENLMVKATPRRDSPIGAVLGPSCWRHVEGTASSHWSPEEGEVLLALLLRLARAGTRPDLYVVTPFRAVAQEARALVGKSAELRSWVGNSWRFADERIGTIHTVQGREADAVIFVLGAPEPRQAGARSWAGATPNLLNVAVTRAKERLYVIGNRTLWREAGCFRLLDTRLPRMDETGVPQRSAQR